MSDNVEHLFTKSVLKEVTVQKAHLHGCTKMYYLNLSKTIHFIDSALDLPENDTFDNDMPTTLV